MRSVVVWRVEKALFAKEAKAGEGARLVGGRWNSPGLAAIYCSGSLALSLLEILVHVETEEDAGVKRVLFRIELPSGEIEDVDLAKLPKTWRSALNPAPCRTLGDAWLRRVSSVALKVPSAIVPTEFNYILNPRHPRFKKARWAKPTAFEMDSRLLANLQPGRGAWGGRASNK